MVKNRCDSSGTFGRPQSRGDGTGRRTEGPVLKDEKLKTRDFTVAACMSQSTMVNFCISKIIYCKYLSPKTMDLSFQPLVQTVDAGLIEN